MAAKDETTLAFYAKEADIYAVRPRKMDHVHMDAFLKRLPAGASVLELGCGSGQDSEAMLARGFDVTPTDGSAELARQAEKRLGRPVRVLLFEEVEEKEVYDGVWASACLLHVPRAELAGIIGRINDALKPGGVFYASFKAGVREGRDRFDRYYNYPSADWLCDAYGPARWQSIDIEKTAGSGYDKQPTDWLLLTAVK